MSKQFEQLEILYKQILCISHEIKDLADEKNFDEIISKETLKSQIINRVLLARKTTQLDENETEILEKLKSKILQSEKENLEIIKELKAETLLELTKLNSQTKLSNQYGQTEEITGSICEYTSD